MKFIPYCNESEINDCSDNTILKVIYEMEELFATENCKKELSIYRCENEVVLRQDLAQNKMRSSAS